jgi:DNA polymerase
LTRRVRIDGLRDWLTERWAGCERCNLADYRQRIVLGDFRPGPLVLIGEAPGANEDERGEPFVGRAGEYLRERLAHARVPVLACSVMNTLACRPPGNRNPKPAELKACSPRLLGTLRALRPLVVVALGGVAAGVLMKRSVAITRERGAVAEVYYPGAGVIPTLLTLHPAYLLRSPALEGEFTDDLRTAWAMARRAERDGTEAEAAEA